MGARDSAHLTEDRFRTTVDDDSFSFMGLRILGEPVEELETDALDFFSNSSRAREGSNLGYTSKKALSSSRYLDEFAGLVRSLVLILAELLLVLVLVVLGLL